MKKQAPYRQDMVIHYQASHVLTDRLLHSWVRCNRKAWLDRYGNPASRVWSAHRALQLDHQQKSFNELIPNKPGQGIRACQAGLEAVVGVRLKGFGPSNELLEAHPPFLQRVAGTSRWGEFMYRPVIARQGRKLTRDHKLALSLIGLLLEQVQKSPVPNGLVISKTHTGLERQTISLDKVSLQKQLKDSLIKLNADLIRSEPPALTSDRRKCSLCSWRGLCNIEAKATGNLNEVSGIGSKRKQMLHEVGISTVHDLATADPIALSNSLQTFGEQHGQVAPQLVSQAKVQDIGIPKRLNLAPAIPELKKAPGVLLYDIESDPDIHDDFLHGFIRLNRKSNGEWDLNGAKYQPILALHEHGSALCWKRLKRKLTIYKDWPVLHYGETEAISLIRLATKQGANEKELAELRNQLIDIHSRLRLHWLLPLNNYGLKVVANWTGFHWKHKGVDGARALLWWRQWRSAKQEARRKSNQLKWLLQYNQDDCFATWAVAKWLFNQD